ncbi:NAD-dependent malic enzyme [Thiobaca trueperi]|uniref:Malate dehydrogenase (Oxaloacetate-decarboxylating)(NADP+) n=1 Tax=Thiobaca trueperi TaxID=127458 RepID=A0A4R3N0C7_9GAMM|nr:NAD-dependent malic enzyme [Thiobaca trueperi]TCT22154.1 malate dehydrogenase (oxaloacetate-decarboxylating)(NADP+) [Thiobaca trueperi]
MSRPFEHHVTDSPDAPVLPVRKRGLELVHDPLLNKGTGFPDSERDALGLRGLVPPQVVSIDDQASRIMENFHRQYSDLDRYSYLETLHDRNETLYYRVLLSHINELTPVIYTPVVGQACSQFAHIYQRARGMYFGAAEIAHFDSMVHNWPEDEVEIVVVTDGSRILGLGDLGANGMGIPIGKLSLYVVGAGFHPPRTLPVMLDVGTGNRALRDDPLYLGRRAERLTGPAYDEVVDAFVRAVHARWPHALIQFEDFSNDQAFRLLARYRDQVLCFNDDIQGTGAVTLAGILSALRITGQKLAEQRVVFLGAGSAARGIADTIVAGMMAEGGLSLEAARRQIWTLDSQGLVTLDRFDSLSEHKRPFAQDSAPIADLLDVIRTIKPTVLIGVCGQAGSFSEAAIREMHRHCERPIVFPLSNPTSKAECTADQAYAWTDGAALFASGSPFDPITRGGRLLVPGQCNNMYIFPGVGQGAISCRAAKVTDSMFYAAACTLASLVGEDSLSVGRLYPDLTLIREISVQIAVAVCEIAFAEGLAGIKRPNDLESFIRARMFEPRYVPYEAV